MQEGRRFNGPAAWRYRIGGMEKEISMVCMQCKERFSNLFQRYPVSPWRRRLLSRDFGLE